MKCFLFFCLSFLLFSNPLLAAPYPATSSSDFLKTEIGLFRSPEGFQVSAEKTNWLNVEPPKGQESITTIYKAPDTYQGVQPLLSIRVDELKKKKTLNQYMREWLKVYPRLGFQVVGSQKVKVTGKKGFLIDLVHSKSVRQLRQVVFIKKNKAFVMTCRGHQDHFKTTVKSCNQIIRNFNWIF